MMRLVGSHDGHPSTSTTGRAFDLTVIKRHQFTRLAIIYTRHLNPDALVGILRSNQFEDQRHLFMITGSNYAA